uniref:Uncharacterized protein n=1 Tax=Nelumbo nucifera TaxID=4432 RepID=A0A822ZNJ9_NELNU|nr:TPA_asm: hypothetical protein HUJ06_002736 [Nelumbo nucifera]
MEGFNCRVSSIALFVVILSAFCFIEGVWATDAPAPSPSAGGAHSAGEMVAPAPIMACLVSFLVFLFFSHLH